MPDFTGKFAGYLNGKFNLSTSVDKDTRMFWTLEQTGYLDTFRTGPVVAKSSKAAPEKIAWRRFSEEIEMIQTAKRDLNNGEKWVFDGPEYTKLTLGPSWIQRHVVRDSGEASSFKKIGTDVRLSATVRSRGDEPGTGLDGETDHAGKRLGSGPDIVSSDVKILKTFKTGVTEWVRLRLEVKFERTLCKLA